MNISELFAQARKDASLLSTLDINELLGSEKSDYLANKTLDSIIGEIVRVVKTAIADETNQETIVKKLAGYRYVENIYELHRGKHIRWIRNGKMTNGGIVTNVKFNDNGSHIVCRNSQNKFFQFKMDDCLVFQQLTMSEQLILMAQEHICREPTVSTFGKGASLPNSPPKVAWRPSGASLPFPYDPSLLYPMSLQK